MNTAVAHFDWGAVYLTCFGVGLVLGLLSFAGGFVNLHGRHFRFGRYDHSLGTARFHGTPQRSPVNAFTAMAFLCWFGGTGYLLARGDVFTWTWVLPLSVLSGVAGAGMIFWFFDHVLLSREHPLEPADTPIIGVLGRVSSPVPSRGVGEMLYSQKGARRAMPIAAEDGVPIHRNAEVVVLRYARGIAYVRRWDEMQQVLLGDEPATHSTE